LLQGLETVFLRIEQHNFNALALANFLQKHEKIAWINYNSLEEHLYYELLKNISKIVNLVCYSVFVLRDAQLASHLANVGDAKTLVIQSSSTTHQQLSEAEQEAIGIRSDIIRVSVGIEHIDDIR
tara:strand:+ start:6837 stop:7211 length:375 start_codon:yes stop_codon:yes gene_type:complete